MTAKPKPDVASAMAAMRSATGRGRGRKSEIYRWMANRHDALAVAFASEPPSWTGLATFFGDAGMLSADGLPPTAAAVRSTWIRVSQTEARQEIKAKNSRAERPPALPDVPETLPPAKGAGGS